MESFKMKTPKENKGFNMKKSRVPNLVVKSKESLIHVIIIIGLIVGIIGSLGAYISKRWEHNISMTSKETFFNDIIKRYGDNYSYEKIVFVNYNTPIIMGCKKHNKEFEILPSDLMKKNKIENYFSDLRNEIKQDTIIPCPTCKKEYFENLKSNILYKFNKIYHNIYSYDMDQYVDSLTPISVTCTKHNCKFKIIPYKHIQGKGMCPICKQEAYKNVVNDMFNKFNKKYHNKYFYAFSKFKGVDQEMAIQCKKCKHIFYVIPRDHMKGKDECPKCD